MREWFVGCRGVVCVHDLERSSPIAKEQGSGCDALGPSLEVGTGEAQLNGWLGGRLLFGALHHVYD